ncbi:MAG: histidinol-phosphatase HisJ family protein [Clostridia bacterium]|nr:histidinol-phosphatase HisJ family protein [Clostridia bacterium]
MYDYHVHTSFSADCEAPINDIIESAIEKGVKEIAITDHIDYDYPSKQIDFSLDFEAYHRTLNDCREKYKDRIDVIKGLEVGLQHHVIDQSKEAVDAHPYDFVICSFHAAEKKELHFGDYFENKTPLNAYIDFYTYTYQCLEAFQSYNVVGHINIIDRYKKYIDKPIEFMGYFDIVEAIFKRVIQNGKGIEINTSSFRYNMDVLSPTMEMLKLYKELNGEIITVGSDAHSPDYIGHQIDYIYDLLKHLGFKYISTFRNMEPNFIKL